jgi:hypothetical protein
METDTSPTRGFEAGLVQKAVSMSSFDSISNDQPTAYTVITNTNTKTLVVVAVNPLSHPASLLPRVFWLPVPIGRLLSTNGSTAT